MEEFLVGVSPRDESGVGELDLPVVAVEGVPD